MTQNTNLRDVSSLRYRSSSRGADGVLAELKKVHSVVQGSAQGGVSLSAVSLNELRRALLDFQREFRLGGTPLAGASSSTRGKGSRAGVSGPDRAKRVRNNRRDFDERMVARYEKIKKDRKREG